MAATPRCRDDQIRCLCEGCSARASRSCTTATSASALYTLRTAREMKQLDRVILGTDAPAGSGVQPLGILRMIAMLSRARRRAGGDSRSASPPATPRGMRKLDCGLIEVGRAADFVIMDKAQHSAGKDLLESVRLGDLPGIGMIIIDGIVRTQRSRNTPPATKVPEVVAG